MSRLVEPQSSESSRSSIFDFGIARFLFRLEALAGFRYLNLQEGLHVDEAVQVAPVPLPLFSGNDIFVSDRFDTQNNFYGGQLGARAEFRRRCRLPRP